MGQALEKKVDYIINL